jgi:hypothetical protein
MPANTIKVDRSTRWGNPFTIGQNHAHPIRKTTILIDNKESSVRTFVAYLETASGKRLVADAKTELRGRNLACWCKDGDLCHADILLQAANS